MAHAHHHEVAVEVEGQGGVRRGAAFIIGGLTSGHGVFHWFTRSFEVMLPEVRDTFGLSGVGVAGIAATRELVSGIVSLPGGVVTDLLRRHWGLVLAGCMALFGFGWLVMGLSPIYPMLLLGMGLVAMAASIWHLPAMAALSHHFAHRRGSALSFHGVGGNVGDTAAPAVTGFLLVILAWQSIITIYAIIPLFLAFLVFWAFRDIGRRGDGDEARPQVRDQMAQTRTVLKNPRIWVITFVAGLRGMAFLSFITFLPLYLEDAVGLSPEARGLHIALLVLIGIGFTPLMGYISDRLGRKVVLIPGMLLLGALTLLMAPYGQGILLIVLLALMGTFLFSDQPILTAAALDLVGERAAATTLGVLSFSRFILSAGGLFIAGYLYQTNVDFNFYYIAALFGLGVLVLMALPMPKGGPGAAREHAHGRGSAGHEHDEDNDHHQH